MLILTRNTGEAIVIGDNATITVLGVRGGQVRLGIDAPKEVSVHREEIYHKIKQEKLAGISSHPKSALNGGRHE